VIGIAAALAVVLIVTGGIFVVTQFLGGGSSPASAGQNSQSDASQSIKPW
jgi:ABC-type spermidine/putrescine transport system permease subunit I